MSVNMNNERIISWIDGIFADLEQTEKVMEQKEELLTHLIDRIKDYMASSLGFDEAFEAAQKDLGDLNELKAGFQKAGRDYPDSEYYDEVDDEDYEDEDDYDEGGGWKTFRLAALSPFIYLFFGFAFGWWAWAWVIIPVISILCVPMPRAVKIVSLSPFVYVLLGFVFGWWAWGWMIIPLSAIMLIDKFDK